MPPDYALIEKSHARAPHDRFESPHDQFESASDFFQVGEKFVSTSELFHRKSYIFTHLTYLHCWEHNFDLKLNFRGFYWTASYHIL